jgi:hypothetical protein
MAKKKQPQAGAAGPKFKPRPIILRWSNGPLVHPGNPLPAVTQPLELARHACGMLQDAVPDNDFSSVPERVSASAGAEVALLAAWAALVQLTDHLSDRWSYRDPNVNFPVHEVGNFLRSTEPGADEFYRDSEEERGLSDDQRQQAYLRRSQKWEQKLQFSRGQRLAERFHTSFNLIASSALLVRNKFSFTYAARTPSEIAAVGQFIEDLKRGTTSLESVVHDGPIGPEEKGIGVGEGEGFTKSESGAGCPEGWEQWMPATRAYERAIQEGHTVSLKWLTLMTLSSTA